MGQPCLRHIYRLKEYEVNPLINISIEVIDTTIYIVHKIRIEDKMKKNQFDVEQSTISKALERPTS